MNSKMMYKWLRELEGTNIFDNILVVECLQARSISPMSSLQRFSWAYSQAEADLLNGNHIASGGVHAFEHLPVSTPSKLFTNQKASPHAGLPSLLLLRRD